MEILVDKYGNRVRYGRPYIQDEESTRNIIIYDPNGYNLTEGLYNQGLDVCVDLHQTIRNQVQKKSIVPAYVITPYGTPIRNPIYYKSYRN
mgnify:CR=1 FL=1